MQWSLAKRDRPISARRHPEGYCAPGCAFGIPVEFIANRCTACSGVLAADEKRGKRLDGFAISSIMEVCQLATTLNKSFRYADMFAAMGAEPRLRIMQLL